MGTIVAKPRKSGKVAYSAQIVIKRKGKIIHREAKTFDRKRAAQAWLNKRETELSLPDRLERARKPSKTLGDVIKRYIEDHNKNIGRTKAQVPGPVDIHFPDSIFLTFLLQSSKGDCCYGSCLINE